MKIDDLKAIVISQYGDKIPKHGVSDKRLEQYSDIFDSGKAEDISSILKNYNAHSASEIVTEARVKKIFDSNPQLLDIRKKCEFKMVDSSQEATKKIQFADGNYTILFDTFTALFIWMMNKAFIYGQEQLSKKDNMQLYSLIFLHFGTALSKDKKKRISPRPATPPHKNIEGFLTVTIFTEIQELFLLCHEIAHIMIEENHPHLKSSLIHDNHYQLKYNTFYPTSFSTDIEIHADELAIEIILNIYERESPEAVQIVCTAIFLLIRYYMWLRISYIDQENDSEMSIWLARNNFLREKFHQIYKWGAPSFIVELFDHLEEVLEPASLNANEIFQMIKNGKI